MEIIKQNHTDEYCLDDILPFLKGQVFHLTTVDAFNSIQKDGFIKNNKNGDFQINTSSENSFGRKNGNVCLFDLRTASEEEIETTNNCYSLHGPTWFWENTGVKRTLNIAYLFLSQEAFKNIIPNETRKVMWETEEFQQVIPKTECWYPNEVPLNLIEKVLILNVTTESNHYPNVMHEFLAANNKI